MSSEPDRSGHYKVFLGMAAGVGKTYRMLREGHAEAAAGRDVVIGYLEPHDRQETTDQAHGLESLPRRRVPVRDVVVEEMDLAARGVS
jgi:two-component system, OmpR family, sensor histidine kinase KdpD